MKKILSLFFVLHSVMSLFAFDGSTEYMFGTVAIADDDELPAGYFSKAEHYLPGDNICITNPANGVEINVLNLGALDEKSGIALLLAPEAAKKLGIDSSSAFRVKLSPRPNNFDEIASGTAILSYGVALADNGSSEEDVPFDDSEEYSATLPEVADVIEEDDEEPEADLSKIAEMDALDEDDGAVEETAPDALAAISEELADVLDGTQSDVEHFLTEETAALPVPSLEQDAVAMADTRIEESIVSDTSPSIVPEPEVISESPVEFADDADDDSPSVAISAPSVEEEAVYETDETVERHDNLFLERIDSTFVEEEPFEEPRMEATKPVPERVDDVLIEEEIITEAPVDTVTDIVPATEEVRAPQRTQAVDPHDSATPQERPSQTAANDAVPPAHSDESEQGNDDRSDDTPSRDEGLGSEEFFAGVEGISLEPEVEIITTTTESEEIFLIPTTPHEPPKMEGSGGQKAPSRPQAQQSPAAADEKPVASPTVELSKPAPRGVKKLESERELEKNRYYVQIATTSTEEHAAALIEKHSKYPLLMVPFTSRAGYKVLVGPLLADEYAAMLEKFKAFGYRDAFVRKIN